MIKAFTGTIAHRKFNTNNMVQRGKLKCCLRSLWCIMCKRQRRVDDHSFLHCPVALFLWWSAFHLAVHSEVNWYISFSCVHMLSIDSKGFGSNSKARVLWNVRLAVLWVIFLEQIHKFLRTYTRVCGKGFVTSLLFGFRRHFQWNPFFLILEIGMRVVYVMFLFSFVQTVV